MEVYVEVCPVFPPENRPCGSLRCGCLYYRRKGVQETRDWNVFEHLTSYFLIQKQVKTTQSISKKELRSYVETTSKISENDFTPLLYYGRGVLL